MLCGCVCVFFVEKAEIARILRMRSFVIECFCVVYMKILVVFMCGWKRVRIDWIVINWRMAYWKIEHFLIK